MDDDQDDLDAEPGAETLGDGDVGVLEDEGLEGAVHVAKRLRFIDLPSPIGSMVLVY